MRTPKLVYLVESGSYSDYHVVGVYSTRENAQLVAEKIGGDVAERPLDLAADELRKGFTTWQVLMDRTGAAHLVRRQEFSDYRLDNEAHVWRKGTPMLPMNLPDCLSVTCLARSERHAIKIANEKRTQMIAQGDWEEEMRCSS